MDKQAPNPDRFKEYDEAADGSGFFLDDGKIFFPFDEYGGWYDEFDNYYNASGVPSPHPTYDIGMKRKRRLPKMDVTIRLYRG